MSATLEQAIRSIEAKLRALERDRTTLREAIDAKREEITQLEALISALEEMEPQRP